MMKDGDSTTFDALFVPWGMGSIVHSLIDSSLVFIQNKDFRRKLKYLFVEKVEKRQDIDQKNISDFDKKILKLNKAFEENYEYKFGKFLEISKSNWENSEQEKYDLGDGTFFVGEESHTEPNGYGNGINSLGETIYRGEFKKGAYHGVGELFYDGSKKRVYMGNFY